MWLAFLFTLMITFETMKPFSLFVALLTMTTISGQVEFSISTGFTGLRNFSPQQKFWGFGQTVRANFHFSTKETLYASMDYYTEGKYKNNFTALAKTAFTNPQQINYTATGRINYRQVSLGLKHYFKGNYQSERELTIYGIAGFGYLFTTISNSFSTPIDTTKYVTPNLAGNGKLDRLTFDLSLGTELPLGGKVFAFAETRTWLPASSTESRYLHNQKNVPLPIIISSGLRVLFGLSY